MSFELQAPSLPVGVPVAHVFGQPVLEVPQGLFIPPEALQVVLESFEGPLDFLLYLIRHQRLDILDIPMALVTTQYLDYIHRLESKYLELAADYLLMAALLIDIKTKMLLPRPPTDPNDEEPSEDPRAELVKRLLEYEQIKLAGLQLSQLPQAERDFCWLSVQIDSAPTRPLPVIRLGDLAYHWNSIMQRLYLRQHHTVVRQGWSVREQMSWIVAYLQDCENADFCTLFVDTVDVALVVLNFIALLELVKEGMITIKQDVPFRLMSIRLIRS